MVYGADDKEKIERDVQDVFVRSLTLSEDKKHLIVKNERHEVYYVDLHSRKISKNAKGLIEKN